ncbi:copper resistance protein CopC [Saccharobesus litoralis]|uniref:Copper resistance protein CopC n=2 Tax=Saccharobesus litoralis TaxID=2172099 RepID=A0A2S0VY07_9ALTE|nr:copper resistance protein CopC [Saccharobesus litoralis]
MKKLLTLLFTLTITFSALGHAKLEAITPSNNAMLMHSPKELALSFNHAVKAVKVVLKKKKGQVVNFSFKPSKHAQKQFKWALPKLSPAMYEVEWTILGSDGHKIKGSSEFMVH